MGKNIDYKKRFEEVLEKARELKEANPSDEGTQNWVNDAFPELNKFDENKARNALISVLTSDFERDTVIEGITVGKIIDWLESLCLDKPFNYLSYDSLMEKIGSLRDSYLNSIIKDKARKDFAYEQNIGAERALSELEKWCIENKEMAVDIFDNSLDDDESPVEEWKDDD